MADTLMSHLSRLHFANTSSFIMESDGSCKIEEGNIDIVGEEKNDNEENGKVNNNDIKKDQKNITENEDDVKVYDDDFRKVMERNYDTNEKIKNSNEKQDIENNVGVVNKIYEENEAKDRKTIAEANDYQVYPTNLPEEIEGLITGKSIPLLDLSNKATGKEKTTNNVLGLSADHWKNDETGNKLYVHRSSMQSGLIKEISNLGELITIRDRERRRESMTTMFPAVTRQESYRRLGECEGIDITQKPTRRHSLTRKSCLKRMESGSFSNRGTMSRKNSYRIESSGNEFNGGSTGRLSRRQSMFNALRDDLEHASSLPEPKRHNTVKNLASDASSANTGLTVSDKEDGDHWSKIKTRFIKRKSFATRMDSRRLSSVSSPETHEPVLMEAEIKKLLMLETLNQMGQKRHRRLSRKDSTARISGEMTVMEESIAQRRKANISGTVLITGQKRQPKQKMLAAVDMSFDVSKAGKKEMITPDDISEDESGRALSVTNYMKKVEKRHRGSVGKETGNEALNTCRRRFRRKKFQPLQKFRRLAKFLVVLLRAWRIHSKQVNNILLGYESLDIITDAVRPDQELMFDVTKFKALKEAKVSQEAKRILKKRPKERTPEEIHYIQIALRNYKSIAEYPVHMQTIIAQRSWYEAFEPKRVILREGQVPLCFYFILSGSAVVSRMEGNHVKTVMFLNRGDSFGDVAIMNHSRRETTVISREIIELLCMADTDFIDTFMSGGIRDPNDPFLRSISFMNGWPIEKLIENPKKSIFCFFKRGTILVRDSTESGWIFVVRSGSASILKKLDYVDPKKPVPKENLYSDLRDDVLSMLNDEICLSHKEQIELIHEEFTQEIEQQNLQIRYFALPEINIATNTAYNELKQMHEEFINQSSISRAPAGLKEMADSGDVKSEEAPDTASSVMGGMKNRTKGRLSPASLRSLVAKGPFLTKNRMGAASGERLSQGLLSRDSARAGAISPHGDATTGSHESSSLSRGKPIVNDWNDIDLPSMADSPMNDLRPKPPKKLPLFVNVRTLVKEQVFGLCEVLFENQPSFSLVSNGVECIMIDKKFFLEYVSYAHMVRLREMTYPYPSDKELQQNLESQILWNFQKKQILTDALTRVKVRKADLNDARALSQITVCA